MKHSNCVRCNKRSVSKTYTSTTTPVGEKIETCNLCTSPKSRKILDITKGFDRFEPHLLNIILLEASMNKNIKYRTANAVNPDTTRYDLLLGNDENLSISTKTLLVEVDESQHFDLAGKYDGEIREEIFFRKFSNNGPGVLRIRVAEDGKLDDGNKCTPVLTKTGGYVCISNEKRYRSNIEKITDYIAKFFRQSSMKIAYINIADDVGIRDMTKLNLSYKETTPKNLIKVEKKWDGLINNYMSSNTANFTRQELEKRINVVEDLVGGMNQIKIQESKDRNPDKKSMTCCKRGCSKTTRSVTGFCPDHKK